MEMAKSLSQRRKKTGIKFLDHTADAGIRITSRSFEELLEEAGRGMNQLLIDSRSVEKKQEITVIVDGESYEDLLVNWLRELLYIHNDKHLVFCDFKVNNFEVSHEQNMKLFGKAFGELYNEFRHHILTEIKLITYHQLYVRKKNTLWEGQVIFDL